MMKRYLLALAVLFASPVAAQNVHPDSGMTTSVGVMEHGDTANVSITGGKAVFTAPNRMTSLTWTVPGVKRGRWYRTTWTVNKPAASVATGSVHTQAGQMMVSATPGSFVLATDLNGGPLIADNFPIADGLDVTPPRVTGESGADPGAFRIFCGTAAIRDIDPIVYPGLAGASHPHEFFGNTAVREDSTSTSLRTTGSTTCGNADTPRSPINRSAYWLPPIVDFKTGRFVKVDILNLYYKQPNNVNDAVVCAGQDGTGSCINLPRGLRMITGYNFATGLGGPGGAGAASNFGFALEWMAAKKAFAAA